MTGTTRPAGVASVRGSSRQSRIAVTAGLTGALSSRQLRTMSSLIVATLAAFGTRATCKVSVQPATRQPSKPRKTSKAGRTLTAGQRTSAGWRGMGL
jgi:hypothetical protein